MAYFRDLSLDFVWILCYDHVILITPSSLIQVSLSLSLSLSLCLCLCLCGLGLRLLIKERGLNANKPDLLLSFANWRQKINKNKTKMIKKKNVPVGYHASFP
jgi:hypothetical protein